MSARIDKLPKHPARVAEKRIQKAIATRSLKIDLDNLNLTYIPESLSQIPDLTRLNLSGNQLTELPQFLCRFTELRELYLFRNNFGSIPDVIRHLKQLRFLGIAVNKLSEFPEWFGELTQLTGISAFGNLLTSLPNSFGQLVQLRELDIAMNAFLVVPKPLRPLKNLKRLDLESNKIDTLPAWIKELSALNELFLHDNPALGIPTEVLGPNYLDTRKNKPATPPAAILDYYFRTRRGRRPLNEAKLILVGRGGVGKTSLIKRIVHGKFNEHECETQGIEIQPWSVKAPDGDLVRLHIWDFGGQEILHATHQFFLTERTLYILVLSGREGHSAYDAEYWLQLIKSFGGKSRVIIALNKSAQHPFDLNRGLLLEKYEAIAGFVETDCKKRTGLAKLKNAILQEIGKMTHRKMNFPSEWFAIKEKLAAMDENFVTWDYYQDICRRLGEENIESQRLLASHLHDLGVALNYADDPRLNDTRVLKPRWVTEGIYAVLRARPLAERRGVLEPTDLVSALDSKNYPSNKHDFLLRLMERFQLCFRLPGRKEQYLVPELLGENQPDLKCILETPGLDFRYQYEVIPEGLLPRFIVQTHALSEQNPKWRWRTGVVLERDGCLAIIRADSRERRTDIHVTGQKAQRRGLLAIIREKFDEQHRDLKGIKVDERVPVPSQIGVTVSYRDLLKREERGEKYFYPENSDSPISVKQLLDGVESPSSRARKRKESKSDISDNLRASVPKSAHEIASGPAVEKPCKLLFLAANPNNTPALALDEECRQIDQKIRASDHRDNLVLITKLAVRPDDLLQDLNQHRPHIVHFSGHGSPAEEIILLDLNREPKAVSKDALRHLFETLKDNIRVVVLNACFSRGQAEAITEIIDCAVGMKKEIGDSAAITFAAAFYRAIGFGRSVQESFQQGKAALMLEGIREENTPELFVRKTVDANSIYLVDSTSAVCAGRNR